MSLLQPVLVNLETTTVERLTEDLLELCVTQGGAEDLALASAVSTTWRTLANDPRHWQGLFLHGGLTYSRFHILAAGSCTVFSQGPTGWA